MAVIKRAVDFLKRAAGVRDYGALGELLRSPDEGVRYKAVERLRGVADSRADDLCFEALADDSGFVRQAAIAHLIAVKNADVVQRMIAAVESDDPKRRLAAAQVLRRRREPGAVEALCTALEHKSDWELRQEAIEALGEIGDARAVGPLICALEDDEDDDGPRGLAADALAAIGDPTAIEPLERVLAGITGSIEDSSVGLSASRALSQLGWSAAPARGHRKPSGAPLAARLSQPQPEARVKAARALGRRKDPATVPALIAALSDQAPEVRGAAAAALGSLADPRAVAPLAALLRDVAVVEASRVPSVVPRGTLVCDRAAEALAKIGGASVEEALVDALTSDSADVRMPSARALVKVSRHRRTLDVVSHLLGDESFAVRRAAIGGLSGWHLSVAASREADYTNADVIGLLERAAGDASEDVRWMVVTTCREFSADARTRAILVKALDDPDWLVRRDAINHLGSLKDDSVLPTIRKMLVHDEDSGVRGEAAAVIGGYFSRLEDQDALMAALGDPDVHVRTHAISALTSLCQAHPDELRVRVLARLRELEQDPEPAVRSAVFVAFLHLQPDATV